MFIKMRAYAMILQNKIPSLSTLIWLRMLKILGSVYTSHAFRKFLKSSVVSNSILWKIILKISGGKSKMLVWEFILMFNRSELLEIYFGTEHKRGIWTLQSLHLSTQQMDAHQKSYTTLLPNIGIYDMKISTNKCTSGMV